MRGTPILRLICASSFVAPVFAQSAGTPGGTAVADETPALQEVVVTAERRSEDLQRIPVAVSAVTADQMQSLHIDTVDKVDQLVPSLQISPEVGSVTMFLRGVGSSIAAIGNEASVAMYVDGVYYSRISPALLRLNDVDRIEVLKGPQGTLFGRNASGGLVQIITHTPQPGDPLAARVSVGYGNFNTVDTTATLSSGLGERAAVELTGLYHDQRNGWGTNLVTGTDAYKDHSDAARGKLVVALTDTTRVTAMFEHSDTDSDIGGVTTFNNEPVWDFKSLFNPALAPTASAPIGFYDTRFGQPTRQKSSYSGGSLRIEQDIGSANLIDTVAYHDTRQHNWVDLDGNALPLAMASLPSTSRELMNELRVVSGPGSAFDWSFGGFYMHQKQSYDPVELSGLLFGSPQDDYSTSVLNTYSPFAQVRFEVLRDMRLTLGARYSHDELHGYGDVQTGIPPALTILPGSQVDDRRNVNEFTYKSALDYQFTPDVLGYVSVSRGYKGATYGTIPITAPPARPEVLQAYEVGLKSELFNRKLRLNSSAFWYDINNQQVVTTPVPGVALTSNAPKARIKGIESELEIALTPRLRLRAAVTYLDARYVSYPDAGLTAPNPYPPLNPLAPPPGAPPFPGYFFGNLPTVPFNASGNHMVRAPDWSGDSGFSYFVPLANEATVELAGNVSFTSKYYFEPDNRLSAGPYALIGASFAYNLPGGHVSVRLWGENLSDRHYYGSGQAFGTFAGDEGAPAAPRTYGLTLSAKY
jgi:iron complex outermembrane recepter protein